ncbi:MAG: hypothetical protein EOP06_09015 [Proteobacteria bacterium]|nr:MAG: hypothetical protein EOP06_09015 [Pseudomonadota bacterium]
MDKFDQFPEPTAVGELLTAEAGTTVGNYYRAECVAIDIASLAAGDVVMTTQGEFHEFRRITTVAGDGECSETGEWKKGNYAFRTKHPTGIGFPFHVKPDKMPPLMWKRVEWEELPRPG